jgi:hypothetical protein
MSDTADGPPAFRIADAEGAVTVREYPTKRGERAEIESGDDRIRLDALLLESISWQRSREDLAALLDDGSLLLDDPTPLSGGEAVEGSPVIGVTNEYAQVELRHVRTDAGEALRIETPARGSELLLGVPGLRALAGHSDTFAFSTFFETPVGPEDTPVEGPH